MKLAMERLLYLFAATGDHLVLETIRLLREDIQAAYGKNATNK